MKTKIYFRVLASFFLLSIFTSCEGDLEPETFDKLSPSNFPKNSEDVRTAVTGCYSKLQNFHIPTWRYRLMMNTATTDEFKCYWGHWSWETYSKFLWNANNEAVISCYKPYVNATTVCVNTIERIRPVEMDEALKERYIAELRGIMALCGYTLYDFYGPVPIVVDPEITMDPNTDFQPERPTKEWMVNYIEEQAKYAMNNLPATYTNDDFGRISKGTAMMVLLKLYMKEKEWQKAADMAKAMMDLNVYELQGTYKSIFSIFNERNEEIVWAVPRTVSDGINTWLAHVLPGEYKSPAGIPVQRWGGYKVPWAMYDKFETENDQRLEVLWRKLNTAKGEVDIRTSDFPYASYGAIPVKYDEDPGSTGLAHGNDYVVYRFAEVLLARAEALNNLNGPNQESVDLINEIRNRAKTTPIDLDQFADKQALNDYILDERFRELFLEGSRREDLIRHGKYLKKAEERGAVITDDHFLLFPIPQWAIDENEKIQQNAGY